MLPSESDEFDPSSVTVVLFPLLMVTDVTVADVSATGGVLVAGSVPGSTMIETVGVLVAPSSSVTVRVAVLVPDVYVCLASTSIAALPQAIPTKWSHRF